MKRIGANEDYDVHLSHYNKNNSEKKTAVARRPLVYVNGRNCTIEENFKITFIHTQLWLRTINNSYTYTANAIKYI